MKPQTEFYTQKKIQWQIIMATETVSVLFVCLLIITIKFIFTHYACNSTHICMIHQSNLINNLSLSSAADDSEQMCSC